MSAPACRRAAPGDLGALVRLERDFPGDRLSRRSLHRLLSRSSAEVWISCNDAGVMGNAIMLYRAHSRTARLYSLMVVPAARGCGVGSVLLETAEAAARRRGCSRMHLEVRSDNPAAIALYRRRGYRVVRRIARFYEDGQKALRMERNLDAPVEAPQSGAPARPPLQPPVRNMPLPALPAASSETLIGGSGQ